jgi:hypothetical protein
VTVGQPITFALDKKALYVQLPNGREHRLRVMKKTSKR